MTWIAVGVSLVAILFVAQWPRAGKTYGCPRCGKVFRISLAEYYACERKGDTRLVDCRGCGREIWAKLM
jgi:DNA-directed RNA polymerase subunit RPC12/RpoP